MRKTANAQKQKLSAARKKKSAVKSSVWNLNAVRLKKMHAARQKLKPRLKLKLKHASANRLHLCVRLLHALAVSVLRVIVRRVIAPAARTVALPVRTVQIRVATTAPAAHLPRAILMLKHRWPTKSRPSRF